MNLGAVWDLLKSTASEWNEDKGVDRLQPG